MLDYRTLLLLDLLKNISQVWIVCLIRNNNYKCYRIVVSSLSDFTLGFQCLSSLNSNNLD